VGRKTVKVTEYNDDLNFCTLEERTRSLFGYFKQLWLKALGRKAERPFLKRGSSLDFG
jgi:hypothetical protein